MSDPVWTLVEAAPLAAALLDGDDRIVEFNAAAARMFSRSRESAIGADANALLAEPGFETTVAIVPGTGPPPWRVVYFEVEAGVIALPDEDGEPFGYVAVNRDIRRRRRLEERLLETRHLEVVGRLAGGVAHDLNSLLTAILGYADLALADRDLPPHIRPDLKQVITAAERAGDLTRQLLAFSRQQVLDPQRIDVNQIVTATLAARRRLAGRTVELVDVPALEPAPVMVDRARLEQALLDVVTNAGEAMPDGGRLVTEARTVALDGSDSVPAGRYVRLTVADNGMGMDAATRSQAFEPFFTTKRDHTGLGLSSVYGFLGQSGGHVTLDAHPGSGTTVALHLPLAE